MTIFHIPIPDPNCHFSTLELSPCDNYCLVTIFCPCPEVITISDNQCTPYSSLQIHPALANKVILKWRLPTQSARIWDTICQTFQFASLRRIAFVNEYIHVKNAELKGDESKVFKTSDKMKRKTRWNKASFWVMLSRVGLQLRISWLLQSYWCLASSTLRLLQLDVQSGWSGCRTGNRKKLSSNQAQLGQATYLTVA